MKKQLRGDISTGAIFTIILLFIIIVASIFLVGTITPENQIPTPTGSSVVIVKPSPDAAKNDLQLYTFQGITVTPAPTSIPTIPFTPIMPTVVHLVPPTSTPNGSPQTPGCGTGFIGQKTGTGPNGCCVMDGPANSASDCCPGVPLGSGSTCQSDNGVTKCIDSSQVPAWCDAKPVIYLYPIKKTLVNVSLTVPGTIPVSIPHYPSDGWENIEAYPDGHFIYQGNSYNELFYESSISKTTLPDSGIVTSISSMTTTLTTLATKLGLNERETNELVAYWMPRLNALNSPYFVVSIFSPEAKQIIDKITINPKPDTMIEFIMYFKPLANPVVIKQLQLPPTPPVRQGFTAVEWGGIIDR